MPNQRQNYFSGEVYDILGTIPSWTVRWGITIVSTIFFMIIVGCYFIKSPDKISGIISITTTNAPIDIVANTNGYFADIFISNNQIVSKDEILAIITSSANYNDILHIETYVNKFLLYPIDSLVLKDFIYKNYNMGEIQEFWTSFVAACRTYLDYSDRDVYSMRKNILIEQIDIYALYLKRLKQQLLFKTEELSYENRQFSRDSTLYSKQIISTAQFEESKKKLLQAKNNFVAFESQIIDIELSMLQLKQQVNDLSIKRDDEIFQLTQNIREAQKRLIAEIKSWKLAYVIVSPIDGYVSFVRKWDVGQNIKINEHFMTIVPTNKQPIIGIMEVPQYNIGKLERDQLVNIKLEGYPYEEYGLIQGRIGYISSIPTKSSKNSNQNNYIVEVVLFNQLTTTNGYDLKLMHKMEGYAEIITTDKRLIMKFINPIIALFKD